MFPKTIDMLMSWNNDLIHGLVSQLNGIGIASDEDDGAHGLSSTMIERWDFQCDQYLRKNGYVGGRLQIGGDFFPGHGAIYVIYDEDHHDLKSSSKYMANLAAICGHG